MKFTRRQIVVLALAALAGLPRCIASSQTKNQVSANLPDSISVFIQYGPNSNFELQLFGDGKFGFSISSNTSSLFPNPEIGYWQGQDADKVVPLIKRLKQLLNNYRGNAPSIPGAPTIAISEKRDEKIRTAIYSLESAPHAVSNVLKDLLRQVNGKWREARIRTLLVQANAKSPDTIVVKLLSTGPEPIAIPSPLASGVFELDLSADAYSDPVSIDDRSLSIDAQPSIPLDWQTQRGSAPLLSIPAGKFICLEISPVDLSDLDCALVTIRMRLLAGLPFSDTRDVVQGRVILGPIR